MTGSEVRRRVLVTGASGMIGRAVTENLIAKQNFDVKVQVRNPAHARASIGQVIDFTRIALEVGDFTRMGDREMRLLTRGADVIVHSAGLVHQPDAPYQEYEVINVRATQALAEAAAYNKVETFIFLSSTAVYGPGPFDYINESAPLKGQTPYAVSKMASEQWLQGFRDIPRIIILRPSMVFGEGDRGNLLSLMRSIKEHKYKHVGGGEAGKSVIYSKDIAHAISLLIDQAPPGLHIFNLSNPQAVSVKELTEDIAETLGLSRKIASLPTGLMKFGAKAAQMFMHEKAPITEDQVTKLVTTTTVSVDKLVTATGFSPRYSLKSALQAEAVWAQENNFL
jgi:nucleoside-diphosphate-sugar epimerase